MKSVCESGSFSDIKNRFLVNFSAAVRRSACQFEKTCCYNDNQLNENENRWSPKTSSASNVPQIMDSRAVMSDFNLPLPTKCRISKSF